MIRYLSALFVATLLASCTWSKSELEATNTHFVDHKMDYNAVLEMVRAGGRAQDLIAAYPAVCAEGIEISSSSEIVELTPINFYYVIVHAGSKEDLKSSSAMKDEGSVRADLGDGWFVVQRGWM